MLVQFSVKNYKSIKDKVTLSMVASSDSTHPENSFEVENRNFRLLKSVGIYGANASGKSNLLEALGIMRWMVIESATKLQSGNKINVTPFKLDSAFSSKPSEFEIVFIHDDERYIYGFSADSNKVHEEWLTAARKSRPRLLFQRKINSDGEYKYDFGPSWKGDKKQLEEKTRDNALFLSVAQQFNNPTTKSVFNWFSLYIQDTRYVPEIVQGFFSDAVITMFQCENDENFKAAVLLMLKQADLGIIDFGYSKMPFEKQLELMGLPGTNQSEFMSDVPKEVQDFLSHRVSTTHKMTSKGSKHDTVEFDMLSDESAGTIRFFSLLGPWISSLKNNSVLFIDELDRSLHPNLTRFLLQQIHNIKEKGLSPQLIFTTHDCSLLDADLFRRDQIWFTEKSESGATDLYSLWDFKPRKHENFRTGYLKGRYGAVPFIGELPF